MFRYFVVAGMGFLLACGSDPRDPYTGELFGTLDQVSSISSLTSSRGATATVSKAEAANQVRVAMGGEFTVLADLNTDSGGFALLQTAFLSSSGACSQTYSITSGSGAYLQDETMYFTASGTVQINCPGESPQNGSNDFGFTGSPR